MDWVSGMQRAIDYIEEHLTEELDYEQIAAQSFSSSYHFQRVFSILCGLTLGKYIRSRRLSLAGTELTASDIKVIDVALKYGYESPDSFAKAFRRFHGVLPSQAQKDGSSLKSFSRLVLKISLEGGKAMNYRIEEKPSLTLVGHKMKCVGSPTNAENTYGETKKHWLLSRAMQRKMKQIRNSSPIWYDVYSDFKNDEFTHIIAVDTDNPTADLGLDIITIPPHLYAIFETERCESPDDEWLFIMQRIVSEWMPSTEYVISDHPQINKLHFYSDYSKRYMEIWLPIEKAE